MKKFLLFSTIIFLISIFGIFLIEKLTGNFFVTNDYYFHLFKAKGSCFIEHYSIETCEKYPPLFSFISSFFSQSEIIFIFFTLFLIIFLIPIIIYMETKNSFWSLLIYFSSSFVYQIIFSAIFAQALFSIFFLLILSQKKFNYKTIIYFILAFLSHYSLSLSLIFVLLYKKFENKNFFPSYAFLTIVKFSFSFLLKIFPMPFFYHIFELKKSKLFLLIIFFVSAFFINPRILHLISLCISLWLPEIILTKKKIYKILLAGLCIFYIIFQFLIWFSDIYQTNLSII